MLRVVLVNPPQRGLPIEGVPFSEEVVPPCALLALAAVLPRNRFATSIVDLNLDVALARLAWDDQFFDAAARSILRDSPDIIGFTGYGNNYPIVCRLAMHVARLGCDALIVTGGPQASAVAEETLRWDAIDAVVVGEGEFTFLDFCESIEQGADLGGVAGLVYRWDGSAVRTPPRPLCDLDTLPFPALDLVDLGAYAAFNSYRFPYDVGRGCPFACAFCSTSLTYGRRFRMKSPEHIATELDRLISEFGLERFWFTHDLFTTNREVVAEICQAIRNRGIRPLWKCYSRADTLDSATLKMMSDAGCEEIFFGVESGSMRIQRELNKRLDVTERLGIVKEAALMLAAVPVGMIAGAPTETRDDLEATMRTSLQLKICWISRAGLNVLLPLSGTAIAAEHMNELVLPLQRADCPAFLHATYDDIAQDRELFTYYYHVPTRTGPYQVLRSKVDAFNNLVLRWFPYTVACLIATENVSINGILELWLQWLREETFDDLFHRSAVFAWFLESLSDRGVMQDMLRYDKSILAARRARGQRHESSFRYNVDEIADALRRADDVHVIDSPRTLSFCRERNTQEVQTTLVQQGTAPGWTLETHSIVVPKSVT